MPIVYRDPAVFLALDHEIVYHDYNDKYNFSALEYHYQVETDFYQTHFASFDIRDLAACMGDMTAFCKPLNNNAIQRQIEHICILKQVATLHNMSVAEFIVDCGICEKGNG